MKDSWHPSSAVLRYTLAAAVSLLCLSACSSSAGKLTRAEPQLEFVRSTATRLLFKFSNHSVRMVSFRGSRGSVAADPWDTQFECKSTDSPYWDLEPFGLVDGDDRNVELLPGEAVSLTVSNEFASRYKGSRCHLSLRLHDGNFIKSNDFRP